MAGAGYKLFNTGDVLTAAQVNTYLMEQTVMVFADAAARTAALSGVVSEGMISYLKDTNAVEVYNGSAWVASDDPNAIQNTIVDAKGDLITATAADVPARLAVGTDAQFLIADSTASTGLKWHGSWTSFTPTLYNVTVGNGTIIAKYLQIGKLVNVYFKFTLGSTSALSGGPNFQLPVASLSGYTNKNFVGVLNNGNYFTGSGEVANNFAYFYVVGTAGSYGQIYQLSSTVPFTWGTGHSVEFNFSYEAA